ncbi:MAG: zinc ribbon domain-containing protein, partial [Isosphaeraceae bacterium]
MDARSLQECHPTGDQECWGGIHQFLPSVGRIPTRARSQKKRLKAKRYACKVTITPRFFPSSKLCSMCGQSNDNLTLRDRVWTCPECGAVHQRDRNA